MATLSSAETEIFVSGRRTPSGAISIPAGTTTMLQARENGKPVPVTWTTSTDAITIVDASTGLVKGVAPSPSTVITATRTDKPERVLLIVRVLPVVRLTVSEVGKAALPPQMDLQVGDIRAVKVETFAKSRLEVDLPAQLETTPGSGIVLSLDGVNFSNEIKLPATMNAKVYLKGQREDEASFSVTAGGKQAFCRVRCFDPELQVLSGPSWVEEGTSTPIRIGGRSARFGPLATLGLVLGTVPDGVQVTQINGVPNEYNLAGVEPGDYQIPFNLGGTKAAQLRVTVRPTLSSIRLKGDVGATTIRVVEGDVVRLPLTYLRSNGLPITAMVASRARAVGFPGLNATIDDANPAEPVLVLEGNRAGAAQKVDLAVGGASRVGFDVQVVPPLESSFEVVGDDAAKETFGNDVRRDFVIVRVTFQNNLATANREALRGKDITVDATSIRVPVGFERIGPTSLTTQQQAQLADVANKLPTDMREFLLGSRKMIDIPQRPYLQADMSGTADSRRQRSPLAVATMLFEKFFIVSTFLNTTYPESSWNPFRNDKVTNANGTNVLNPYSAFITDQFLSTLRTRGENDARFGQQRAILQDTVTVSANSSGTEYYMFLRKQTYTTLFPSVKARFVVPITLNPPSPRYSIQAQVRNE